MARGDAMCFREIKASGIFLVRAITQHEAQAT